MAIAFNHAYLVAFWSGLKNGRMSLNYKKFTTVINQICFNNVGHSHVCKQSKRGWELIFVSHIHSGLIFEYKERSLPGVKTHTGLHWVGSLLLTRQRNKLVCLSFNIYASLIFVF